MDFITADRLYKVYISDKKNVEKNAEKKMFDQLPIFWWNALVKRDPSALEGRAKQGCSHFQKV